MSVSVSLDRHPVLKRLLAMPVGIRRRYVDHTLKEKRAMLARIADNVVGDMLMSVEEFEGRFYLSPSSNLVRRLVGAGFYEPELAELFRSMIRPDRDVVDVGANIGFFSVLAARHLDTGRVLAVEPTAAAIGRLKRNIELNGVADKVVLFEGVLADSNSERTINVVPGREEFSSLGSIVHPAIDGSAATSEKVQAESLDALVERHRMAPGLIKVDVEGAEGFVFRGARETLKTHRPTVISELARPLLRENGSSPEEILEIFAECNYRVVDMNDPDRKPGVADFTDIVATPL